MRKKTFFPVCIEDWARQNTRVVIDQSFDVDISSAVFMFFRFATSESDFQASLQRTLRSKTGFQTESGL